MKVLVTGATGLVGNALKHIETEFEMIFLTRYDCNLLDYE